MLHYVLHHTRRECARPPLPFSPKRLTLNPNPNAYLHVVRFQLPDTAGESLLPIGMEAFLNYNPIRATTDPSVATDFYRRVRCAIEIDCYPGGGVFSPGRLRCLRGLDSVTLCFCLIREKRGRARGVERMSVLICGTVHALCLIVVETTPARLHIESSRRSLWLFCRTYKS